MELAGKRVVVFGLGKSGVAAAKLCLERGARVVATDARPAAELSDEARALPEVAAGGHDAIAFDDVDLVVVSPGVPPLPLLDDAERRGSEVIGELELASRFLSQPMVLIGGTNGKSTTTALVARILEACGSRVFAGGNLGTPLSVAVGRPYDVLVVEASSFQLERAPTLRPNVSVLLNVSEDHLDRYESFRAYADAKGNAFKNQRADDVAVVLAGDPVTRAQAERGAAKVLTFGPGGDYEVDGRSVVEKVTGERFSLENVDLHGAHNWLNASAAVAACRGLSAEATGIREGLATFAGLPHRTARVAEIGGVAFYDDSKGTNVGAAVTALRGLAESRAVLIAGGKDKGGLVRAPGAGSRRQGPRARADRRGRAAHTRCGRRSAARGRSGFDARRRLAGVCSREVGGRGPAQPGVLFVRHVQELLGAGGSLRRGGRGAGPRGRDVKTALQTLFRRTAYAGPPDQLLAAVAIGLLGFGVMMVYSASAVEATNALGDPQFFLKRQAIFALAALLIMLFVSRFDYRKLRPFTYWVLGIACAGLVAVLVIGSVAGGAKRWISLGPVNIQPSEVVKLALILWLGHSLAKKGDLMKTFKFGMAPHILMCGILVVLCMRQPDFGGAVVLLLLTFTMLFVAGARVPLLIATGAVGAAVGALAVRFREYRWERIVAWFNMEEHKQDLAYQPFQSVMAFGSGETTGLGLGRGLQVLYLPEAHNDFVASIIGEELGFVGVLALCTAYLVIVSRGVRAALAAEDDYGAFLAFGISVLFGIQALINLAVAMAILPTKGLTLPFVSYGGSSLLVNAAAMGVLLNVSRPRGAASNLRVDAAGPQPEASAMLVTEADFAPAPEGRGGAEEPA